MEEWTLIWTRLTSIEDASSLNSDIPGVYRLSYRHEDGNFYVFYVGQSEDIRERLLQHQDPAETNPGIKAYISSKKCYFRYARITQAHVRNGIERQVYKYYHPECNTAIPPGEDDIKGNLT